MTKVITYGTFDLLHYGHIRLLERAKALGDYLIVGVTSDDYDKTRGKINKQQSLIERIEAVKATGLADEVIVEEYDGQKINDIIKYHIDIFTLGDDWKGVFDYLNEYCTVVYLPRTVGISSSELRTEKSKLKIAVVGSLGLKEKFIAEASFVNGVEIVEQYEAADAVYIVSLPEDHYKDCRKALEDGKHVLCNSPISIHERECSELLSFAKSRGLVLYEAIKTAYLTAYQRMILVAKSGKIGDILSVDASCSSFHDDIDYQTEQNTICGWGPTAMLPVFQLLGTEYKKNTIVSHIVPQTRNFDGFTKIDFYYPNAAASVKVAKLAKTEGSLVVTGSKGYIYVPAPWWKTDYFELRYEKSSENRRYFYQMDGIGTRYQIGEFAKAVQTRNSNSFIGENISVGISKILEQFFNDNIERI